MSGTWQWCRYIYLFYVLALIIYNYTQAIYFIHNLHYVHTLIRMAISFMARNLGSE